MDKPDERSDTERLDFVIQAFLGADDALTMKIAAAIMLGKEGRAAIDTAMDSR